MEKHAMNIKNSDDDYFFFEDLRESLDIKDTSVFSIYLKEIYKDLADRAESDKKSGISKITFWEYMKIPVFISEKLFCALDEDNNNFLNSNEFSEGLFTLYTGGFEETVEIIFRIMDFDKDGFIEKGDAKILLSYLPMKSEEVRESQLQYKSQMASLDEIDEILKLTFGENNEKLDLKEFITTVENKKSDVFLQLICFLYLNKPFDELNIQSYQNFRKSKPTSDNNLLKTLSLNSNGNSPHNGSSRMSVRMPSPCRQSSLRPVETFFKINLENLDSDFEDEFDDGTMSPDVRNSPRQSKDSPFKKLSCQQDLQLVRMDNTKVISGKSISENVEENLKNSKSLLDSPSTYLKRKPDKHISDFSLENSLISMNNDEVKGPKRKPSGMNQVHKMMKSPDQGPTLLVEAGSPGKDVNKRLMDTIMNENMKVGIKKSVTINIDSPDSSNKNSPVDSPIKKSKSLRKSSTIKTDQYYENWVYKLTENNKMKKYYLVVLGKDIYYYKSDTKQDLLGMHNLSGCFVKENAEKKIEGQTYYSFSVIFSNKTRRYFTKDKEEMQQWMSSLKQAIGYQSFFDFYDVQTDLGEGKFGMVKLGIHKNSGEKVAIKIIKKDSMTVSDMELVRSEIDIMKLCKHPNVVRLLDHFENSEYIFIVMEYLAGGDLSNFFNEKNFDFDEPTAANVISQICSGIKYIHQFGIVHRDLKPENIMLTTSDGKGSFKVMDFGLSKILGPLEKACDGFGTLSFVAPEVLIRQPYNKQIDIWSIGVILYYMLSGILPFDDESDNEEIIAKRTVFVELQFPPKKFKGRSKEVLDFITKCLIKDPNKRISIEQILEHEWITKHTMK
jgi:Ca2+-binding EF-hand superfamily protein